MSGLGQHGTELSKMKQGVSFVTLISYTAVQVVQCSSVEPYSPPSYANSTPCPLVDLYPLPSCTNSTVSLSCFLITC